MTDRSPVRVELESGESIAERGTVKIAWLVRQGDAWVRAGELSGAVVEQLEPGAGTVWRHRIELSLVPGTRLMRVESRPAKVQRRSALDYLAREARKPPRQVRRTTYRVGRRGELERESAGR